MSRKICARHSVSMFVLCWEMAEEHFYLWHLMESFLYHTGNLAEENPYCVSRTQESTAQVMRKSPGHMSCPSQRDDKEQMKWGVKICTGYTILNPGYPAFNIASLLKLPSNISAFFLTLVHQRCIMWQCKTHMLTAFSLAFAFVWWEHHGLFAFGNFWVILLPRSGVEQAYLQRMTIS